MAKIHSTADVQTQRIGERTVVWQFSIILPGASIGEDCNINCHTFIENDVVIGNNVTIKAGVYLWDGITLEDGVQVGPNVTFTNDKYPKAKREFQIQRTIVRTGASIGAATTVLGGVEIGKGSLIGAGSLVTKSVPDFALVYGNPAQIMGWLDDSGSKLIPYQDLWKDSDGNKYRIIDNKRVKIEE